MDETPKEQENTPQSELSPETSPTLANIPTGENLPPKIEKRLTGRPAKLTVQTLKKIEEAYAMGCTDVEVCIFADISQKTLYQWRNQHPSLGERWEMLKEHPVLKAREVVTNAVKEGKTDVAQWYLERKARAEFGKAENTVNIGINLADLLDKLDNTPENAG